MKQYLDLLKNIIENGIEKESGRANMPNTIGISHGEIKMDLQKGFPLLTTKKMYWKGIVHELLWFLRGETNIKYLVDNNVNIWNDDAYRWYLKKIQDNFKDHKPLNKEEFLEAVKNKKMNPIFNYEYGDLGKVYGHQWRNQNGVDQVKDVIEGLKTNPYSRYHIIDGWNKADFGEMALPPCHLLYQFIVRPLTLEERQNILQESIDAMDIPKFYLDLNMYQRSCDSFLGVPFNIASMSILLTLFSKVNNMLPGVATWIGGDTHFYVDHLPMINEQLFREPYALPELKIKKELNSLDDILNLAIDDFEIVDYKSHSSIKAELFTGLKK